MINEDLIKYIDAQKLRGVSREDISLKLSNVGWKTEDINEGLEKFFPTFTPTSTFTPPEPLKPNLMPKVVGPAGALPIKKIEVSPNLNPSPIQDPRTNSFDNFRPEQKVQPVVTANIMSPGPLPQGAVTASYRKDYQNLETVSGEPKKHWGRFIAVLIIVLLLLGGGGVIFASVKGYINLPFEIPFLKPTPEKAMAKMMSNFSAMKTLHHATDLELSVTVEELNSMKDSTVLDSNNSLDKDLESDKKVAMTNKVKIKTDMDVDFTNPESINLNAVTNGTISIFGGSSINLDSEFRMINKTFYMKIPDIGMINEFAGEPNSWISFNENDLKELLKEQSLVSYDEAKLKKIKTLIEDTKFVESITEVGIETIDNESTRHYQVLVNKEALKNFVSRMIDILNESELNLQKAEILSQMDSIDEIKADIWVVKASFAPKKFTFILSTKDIIIKDSMKVKGKITINSVISKINEKVTVDVPEVSRSMVEIINKSKLKSKDAAIKANLANTRVYAESFYDKTKNSYGKANLDGSCITPAKSSMFENSEAITELLKVTNGVASCYSTSKGYAISVPFASDPTTMLCIDNSGDTIETKIPLTSIVCK
ncbi:hypothetical protein IT400_02580 [Candidatus Nomurabacteria bacterium]|nr:hypothetical protein [Candidatus Nomurabacteria bacterium]